MMPTGTEIPDVSTADPGEPQGWRGSKKVISPAGEVQVFRWYEHTAFPVVCRWYLVEKYEARTREWHPAFGAVVAEGTH